MKIVTIAKYIDQPVILSRLHSKMPAGLAITGAGVWGYETFKKNKNHSSPKQNAFKMR